MNLLAIKLPKITVPVNPEPPIMNKVEVIMEVFDDRRVDLFRNVQLLIVSLKMLWILVQIIIIDLHSANNNLHQWHKNPYLFVLLVIN